MFTVQEMKNIQNVGKTDKKVANHLDMKLNPE